MGLAFLIHTGQSGETLHVDLFVEGPEGSESYIYELDLEPRMESEWVRVGIVWDYFLRVDWEEDGGSPFTKPDQISGVAFGFGTEEEEQEGELWIDDLGWMIPMEESNEDVQSPVENDETTSSRSSQEESRGFNLPCIGSLVMPVGLVGVVLIQRKKVRKF